MLTAAWSHPEERQRIAGRRSLQANAEALRVLPLTRRSRGAVRVGEGALVGAARKSKRANLAGNRAFGAVPRRAAGPRRSTRSRSWRRRPIAPNRRAVRIAACAAEQANVALFHGRRPAAQRALDRPQACVRGAATICTLEQVNDAHPVHDRLYTIHNADTVIGRRNDEGDFVHRLRIGKASRSPEPRANDTRVA